MSIFIIAEAGCNHQGSISEAYRLLDAAKEAGADAIKFQYFRASELKRPELEPLELDEAELVSLQWRAKECGLEFMCTPFGVMEAMFLRQLVKRMKIASGCIAWFDLLREVRDMPIILSTGMATTQDINAAFEVLDESGAADVTLLHCTSAYPCPIEAVNLRAIDTLADMYRCPVGFSDHTNDILTSIAAAAKGAVVIEKHMTMDRNAAGPDHKASIEPWAFKSMVNGIRLVETMLGNGVKQPQPCEAAVRKIWRD